MPSRTLAAGKYILLWIAAFASLNPLVAQDTKITRTQIGVPVEVTAGQEFYAETIAQQVPGYKLERPV